MRVTPITASFGVEIDGIDLGKGLSADQAADLYEIMMDRAVLLFRDQPLTSEAHLALGDAFGPLAPKHPLYPTPDGFENIMIIRNDAKNPPESEKWHTDISCDANPPFVSLLLSKIIPDAGGDTLFCDMRAVHDALSEPVRALLAGLMAEHRMDKGFDYLREMGHHDRADMLMTDAIRNRNTDHPVIKHHPSSGRPFIYVNQAFTTRILGLTKSESTALLNVIYDLIHQPRHQLRIRWKPDMLAVWDNWSTQHMATGDHFPKEREMRRVTVIADKRSRPFTEPAMAAAE